jgi:hypothetical protein
VQKGKRLPSCCTLQAGSLVVSLTLSTSDTMALSSLQMYNVGCNKHGVLDWLSQEKERTAMV